MPVLKAGQLLVNFMNGFHLLRKRSTTLTTLRQASSHKNLGKRLKKLQEVHQKSTTLLLFRHLFRGNLPPSKLPQQEYLLLKFKVSIILLPVILSPLLTFHTMLQQLPLMLNIEAMFLQLLLPFQLPAGEQSMAAWDSVIKLRVALHLLPM